MCPSPNVVAVRLGNDQVAHRSALVGFSPSLLRSTLVLCASVTITGYCLWAFERDSLLSKPGYHVVLIQLTIIPIILGVLHVLRLLDAGRGGAPVDLALSDWGLQGFGLLWLALMAAGLYG